MSAQPTRKPVSRSLRFDIFTRDGFTCQYCGHKPPDVTLELDHLTPQSKGGGNEEMNLVTSCWDCNRGKSDKILGDVRPTPDADTQYLKTEQQRLEYERYLRASTARDAVQSKVIERIQDLWCSAFNMDDTVAEHVVKGWLVRYSPEHIERGIEASIPSVQMGTIGGWNFNRMVRYISAVIRNIASEENE